MDGKKFILAICALLEAEDQRLYDSQIVKKICQLGQYELKKLIEEYK